jgi:hypothetical protein
MTLIAKNHQKKKQRTKHSLFNKNKESGMRRTIKTRFCKHMKAVDK